MLDPVKTAGILMGRKATSPEAFSLRLTVY